MSEPSRRDDAAVDRAHQLTLDPLSDRTWRLCDRSFASCDADSVVAYIELRDNGMYEVTWVSHGVGTATYETLGELLRDAGELFARTPPRGAGKPIPIPHRPPLALT
ncbi:MAG TPA: hypothetical protein VNR62_11575 [Cellulomonas sp.]|jgi:hypothetical protein|nr:hypothetical protein [Cellulomonas sp.]